MQKLLWPVVILVVTQPSKGVQLKMSTCLNYDKDALGVRGWVGLGLGLYGGFLLHSYPSWKVSHLITLLLPRSLRSGLNSISLSAWLSLG